MTEGENTYNDQDYKFGCLRGGAELIESKYNFGCDGLQPSELFSAALLAWN